MVTMSTPLLGTPWKRLVAVVALVGGLLASAGLGSSTAAPGRPEAPAAVQTAGAQPVVMLTFNMCGESCNKADTGVSITTLMQTIDAKHPAVVFLQEVCRNQYDALKALSLQPGHWALHGWTDVTIPTGCGGSDSFGDAILTHGAVTAGSVDTHSLGYAYGGQSRKVICMRTHSLSRPTEVCSTHIGHAVEIGHKHQTDQIHNAYADARKDGKGVPLVLAGDFNVSPTSNALDAVYSRGGGGAHGTMREVDACPGSKGRAHHTSTCNAYTHYGTVKNDFMFVSDRYFSALSGQALTIKYSDHLAVLGRMTLG
jgi:endonuclease/exonuclease/phosphatase family metal-dependent hydrolase